MILDGRNPEPTLLEPIGVEDINVEPISETVVALTIPTDMALAMKSVADAARGLIGGQLITVSLWRPIEKDLVRVYSSMPKIYRPGGISSELGTEWLRRCVGRLESFLAEDENAINSDAFEHQEVLGALHLEAAVNAVVAKDGVFLGCLNLLGRKGSYSGRSVRLADSLTAELTEILTGLRDHAAP